MEPQAGAGYEVAHCAGDENLSASGQLRDARRDVDGDPRNIAVLDVDLSGMEPAAHLNAERANLLDDGRGATHGAGGTVKGRQKAIAQGLDLAASETGELLADDIILAIEDSAPAPVTELGRTPR